MTSGGEGGTQYDATGNKVCINVQAGAGIPTHEELGPVLRRRLLVPCSVDGPLVDGQIPVIL